MLAFHVLFALGVLFCTLEVSQACKGCINLDEYNFPKIVPRFEAVLVKFDIAYPYGEKHETFAKFAEEIVPLKNIILGEVGVKDYGDKENEEFAKKYGVNSKDDLPAVKLFLKNVDKHVDLPAKSDLTIENLRNLIRDNTNVYIGLPGCIEKYDKLAMEFIQSDDKEKHLDNAKKIAEDIDEEEKSAAHTYMVFMKKILQQGMSFISQEKLRLGKIIKEGKMNDNKKQELSQRLNILHSFAMSKDEL